MIELDVHIKPELGIPMQTGPKAEAGYCTVTFSGTDSLLQSRDQTVTSYGVVPPPCSDPLNFRAPGLATSFNTSTVKPKLHIKPMPLLPSTPAFICLVCQRRRLIPR